MYCTRKESIQGVTNNTISSEEINRVMNVKGRQIANTETVGEQQ